MGATYRVSLSDMVAVARLVKKDGCGWIAVEVGGDFEDKVRQWDSTISAPRQERAASEKELQAR